MCGFCWVFCSTESSPSGPITLVGDIHSCLQCSQPISQTSRVSVTCPRSETEGLCRVIHCIQYRHGAQKTVGPITDVLCRKHDDRVIMHTIFMFGEEGRQWTGSTPLLFALSVCVLPHLPTVLGSYLKKLVTVCQIEINTCNCLILEVPHTKTPVKPHSLRPPYIWNAKW